MEYRSGTNVYKNISKLEASQHRDNIWECLDVQRREGLFCDVTVQCKDKQFYAHKCVLTSISDKYM